jgi:glycolate oxidase FAD binding subunit
VHHPPVGDAGPAVETTARVMRSNLVPSALELVTAGNGASFSLVALFEGVEASVEDQVSRCHELCGVGTISDRLPAGFGRRPYGPGDLGLRIAHPIADLAAVLRALAETDAAFDLRLRVSAEVGIGITAAGCSVPAEGAVLPAAVAELRGRLAGNDASVVVVHAPAAAKRTLDVWGPVRGLELMRRVKAEFDPHRRLAPGRFVGGI